MGLANARSKARSNASTSISLTSSPRLVVARTRRRCPRRSGRWPRVRRSRSPGSPRVSGTSAGPTERGSRPSLARQLLDPSHQFVRGPLPDGHTGVEPSDLQVRRFDRPVASLAAQLAVGVHGAVFGERKFAEALPLGGLHTGAVLMKQTLLASPPSAAWAVPAVRDVDGVLLRVPAVAPLAAGQQDRKS